MPHHELELRVVKIETDLAWIKDKMVQIDKKQTWFMATVAGAVIVNIIGVMFA